MPEEGWRVYSGTSTIDFFTVPKDVIMNGDRIGKARRTSSSSNKSDD